MTRPTNMSLPHFDEVTTVTKPGEPVWLQMFRVIFTDSEAVSKYFNGINIPEEVHRFDINVKKRQIRLDYNEQRDTFLQHKLGARLSRGEVIDVGTVVIELHDKNDVIYQRSHFGGVTLEDVFLSDFSWQQLTNFGYLIDERIAEGQLTLKYKTWRVEQLPPKD